MPKLSPKQKKMQKYYIHTIRGNLAVYVQNEQIYYANKRVRLSELLRCTTLNQLRKEEDLSRKWRASQGWGYDKSYYRYFILYIDAVNSLTSKRK